MGNRGQPPQWMVCVDPGLVTGLATLHYRPEAGITVVQSMEGDLKTAGLFVGKFLHDHVPHDSEVVIERFTITVATAKNSQAPWSLEVIGMAKWLIWDIWNLDPEDVIHLQTPVEAKRLVTNEVLHDAHLWHRGGAGHANDAIRHGVRRFATLGVYDPFTG